MKVEFKCELEAEENLAAPVFNFTPSLNKTFKNIWP